MRGLNFGNQKYKIINENEFIPHICSDRRITIPIQILKKFPLKSYDKSICIVKIINKSKSNIRIKKINARNKKNFSISFEKEINFVDPKVKIIDIISEQDALKRDPHKELNKVAISSLIPQTTGLTPIYIYKLNNSKIIVGGYYKKDIIFNTYIHFNELTLSALGLYYAEGGKTTSSFSNSYPRAVNIILDFIEDVSNIKRRDIRASIYTNLKLKKKEKNLEKFWTEQTGIEDFRKIHLSKNSKSPCGTLDFKFGGEVSRIIFLNLIKHISNQIVNPINLIRGIFSGDGSPVLHNKTTLTHHLSLSKENKEEEFKFIETMLNKINIKIKKGFYKTTTKAIIFSDWPGNIDLLFFDLYRFNPPNRLIFANKFLNMSQTKALLNLENGDIIGGRDIFEGSKRIILSLRNYDLIKLRKITDKPNTRYRVTITKEGNKIIKKIKDYKKYQYKQIKKDFINFCTSLEEFNLLEDGWYGNLR